MKLSLHIGSNKTASSYIQSILFNNQETLKNLGLYYPRTGLSNRMQHLDFVLSMLKDTSVILASKYPPPDFSKLMLDLKEEVKDQKHVIISSEGFFNWQKLNKSMLNDFFAIFETVEIHVYLREHSDYITSWYNSRVRRGVEKHNFHQFVEKNTISYLDILTAIKTFKKVKALHVKPYFREYEAGSIFHDFMQTVAPNADISSISLEKYKANTSLNFLSLEFFFNSQQNQFSKNT